MIKVLNEEEMIKYLDELAEIYKLAIKSTDDSVNFLKERIKNSINSNLNTVIVVAMEDEKIVGFVYGFDFKPETWWAVQIAPSLPKEEFDWYENTFELNELMVLPEYQSKGYGKLLMNKIRDDFNYSRILPASKLNAIPFFAQIEKNEKIDSGLFSIIRATLSPFEISKNSE